MFGRRGDLPEPPPKGWDRLGVRPGFTVEKHPAAQIAELCKAVANAGDANWNRSKFRACVDMNGKRVLLPQEADREEEAALIAHEGGGHTWGLTHEQTGRHWLGPDGKPAQPITPGQAQMMIAMAQAEQRKKPGLIGSQSAFGQ